MQRFKSEGEITYPVSRVRCGWDIRASNNELEIKRKSECLKKDRLLRGDGGPRERGHKCTGNGKEQKHKVAGHLPRSRKIPFVNLNVEVTNYWYIDAHHHRRLARH